MVAVTWCGLIHKSQKGTWDTLFTSLGPLILRKVGAYHKEGLWRRKQDKNLSQRSQQPNKKTSKIKSREEQSLPVNIHKSDPSLLSDFPGLDKPWADGPSWYPDCNSSDTWSRDQWTKLLSNPDLQILWSYKWDFYDLCQPLNVLE